MLGICSNCGTQIMDLNQRGQDRLLTNYRDHIVELSNGTLMRVGVCVNCKELLVAGKKVKETADKIMEKHKEYWRNDEHAPRGFEDFSITDPNTDEDKFRKKRGDKIVKEEKNLQKQKDDFNLWEKEEKKNKVKK